MSYKNEKINKMKELYELKKSYSKSQNKSYAKMSDALVISNDRINTIVLTFGILVCSLFIGIIIK